MASGSPSLDSFTTRSRLAVGDRSVAIHSLGALDGRFDVARLPYSMKIVLENLLRHEDGRHVHAADIEAVAGWAARQAAGTTRRHRDRLHPRAGPHAGLHRRPRRGRPGRHARRPGDHGRRRHPGQSPRAGRAGDRPLGDRRVLGPARRPSPPTSRSSTGATSSATSSCAGPSRPSTGSGWSPRAPASVTR